MADSYYEDQPQSAITQDSANSEPYYPGQPDSTVNGTVNGEGAISPEDSYTNGGEVKQEVKQEPPTPARKTLASWVGFSNYPNQVHRRSQRYVAFHLTSDALVAFCTTSQCILDTYPLR
jgi:septin 7